MSKKRGVTIQRLCHRRKLDVRVVNGRCNSVDYAACIGCQHNVNSETRQYSFDMRRYHE